jgi:hypothetical protein
MSATVLRGDPGRPARERGTALILGVFFTIIVTGIVVTGTMVLRTNRQKTETNFRLHGQAAQFARAGLIEALSWYRKQTSQPVLAFDPRLDTAANPPVLDTIDPDIGIVREFSITGAVWGRYEVWKQWDADPIPARLDFRRKVQMTDVSLERGAATLGNVWRIRAIGYIYRRADPSRAFDEQPNHVLGRETVETEMRRLTLAPPGEAAICTRTPSTSIVNSRGRVQGGAGAGIFYPSGVGNPVVSAGSVIGSPALAPSATYDDSVEAVFGVNADDLSSLADDRIYSDATFPNPVPQKSVYYCETNLTFTAARPLKGNGIVYVRGNVTMNLGSNSWFTGFLYVDGNVTLTAPNEFNGTLVATGYVQVLGVSDFSNVTYDDGALNALRTEVGQYRLSGAIRPVHTTE